MDKVITFSPQYDTMKMITGVSKMCCDGVIQCLEKEKVSILIKDRHTCLDLNDSNMYVLKKGIVKVSLIMQDEREFNITYLQGPDVVSLYCDCLTQFRDCHPKIRIESEQAELYCVSKEKFGSLTLAHSQNSQMSFMYGFFFVKFLFFTVVCVVIVI